MNLEEALRLLKDKNVANFEIHMVGDGVDAQSLKKLISGHSLSDFFIFHGAITDKT